MKYTLLEICQSILSSMDSDEINSISDSVESMQVANVVRSVYFDVIGRANLPEHYSLVTLDPSGDATKPVLMSVPATIEKIVWVKYNKILEDGDPINMELVQYLSLEEFMKFMNRLNTEESNISSFSHTIGPDTFTIVYQTDRQPTYYTTFNDNTLIFDSYKSDIDTTLQKSKTLCYGKLVIPFTMTDTFTPNLDEEQFNLLLNESKSLAWMELKQAPHSIAERNSKRAWSAIQSNKFATQQLSAFDQLPNFGRK